MKSTFKRNLILGFGASLVILIASAVASFVSIKSLLSSADWVNHTNEIINNLNEVVSALQDAETGQRGYLLTGDEEFLTPYNGAYARTINIYNQVKSKTLDNPVQQQNSIVLKELIDKRMSALQTLIEVKKGNGTLHSEDLKKGKDLMDNITELIKNMKAEEASLLVVRTQKMNNFASSTPIIVLVGAFIAFILTILFYLRVKNDFEQRLTLQLQLQHKEEDISRRIAIIQNIANNISEGDYSIRVQDDEKDALGGVAVSLNKMATSLEYSFGLLSDKEWLQNGVAKLNDVMLVDQHLQTLTQHIIEFVAHYTHSQAGAFYLIRNIDSLVFYSGFSFVPPKEKESIKMGEGIVGQSALREKQIYLEEISDDTLYISHAMGDIKPRYIMALPLNDGYGVKGVLEVASLTPYSKRDLDFFKTISHNIGVALSTALSRQRLQELLDETQAQAEELQTQHGELENLNSELEVQAEKLQASEEELRVQQEELRQANQELEERSMLLEDRNILITERNREIQVKAEELAQSARYKSEFLANMSHELRTPLNSILLLSRLMAENNEANLTSEQVEYARVIQSSGNGLLSLIDEILDLSKIEAGKMQLEYQQVSIDGIVKNMKALFEPVAKEKNIMFRTAVQADVPELMETDKLRLEQVIRNLISNAIKFTAKGYVDLEFAKHTTQINALEIRVKDSGIGIQEDKQQLIFEAFQQADGSTRRKYGGTGLGLSISRELTKLLGGEIVLWSEVNKGSVFTIIVPVTQNDSIRIQPESEMRLPVITRAVEPEISSSNYKKYTSTVIPADIPDDREMIVSGDKCILIIEDDTNFAKSILNFTRKAGYKGLVAVRGDEGVALARKYTPHAILLDIQLPVRNGWEVMEDLKGDPHTRHIPVHIMSSYEVKNESLTKGAIDFINKPVAIEKMQGIFEKIEFVLNRHPKKVLIVEENQRHAQALAFFLETFNINLEIKSQVDEGISSLQKNEIDCVILDMGVPDQGAYDTLEGVKKTPGLENIPIIIFTGKSLSRGEELRIKQYADSIVVKTANSYQRILDEVSLFLHLVEKTDKKDASSAHYKLGALNDVLKDKTVLVADDDVRNIFSLTKALENYKMNVIMAVDGKDALKQLKENPQIDIVLLDMMMPEMDGYETAAHIRSDPRLKDLPVIAVTAKAMMGDRTKCINAGASDYITKPVDVDQLMSLLRVWLYDKGSRK